MTIRTIVGGSRTRRICQLYSVATVVSLILLAGCGREHRWDGTYRVNNGVGRLSSSISADELFPEVGMNGSDLIEVTTSQEDIVSMQTSVFSASCLLDHKEGSQHVFTCIQAFVEDPRLGLLTLDLTLHIDVDRCWRGLFIAGDITSDTDRTFPAGPASHIEPSPNGCTGGAIGI